MLLGRLHPTVTLALLGAGALLVLAPTAAASGGEGRTEENGEARTSTGPTSTTASTDAALMGPPDPGNGCRPQC